MAKAHIRRALSLHWNELFEKAKIELVNENGQSNALRFWLKSSEICQETHPESLPCLTVADFDSFITYQTQSFITQDCPALEYYNEVIGNCDFTRLLQEDREANTASSLPSASKSTSEHVKEFKGLPDSFGHEVSEAIASFLEIEFPDPALLLNTNLSKHKECYFATESWTHRLDCECIRFPRVSSTTQESIGAMREIDSIELHKLDSSERKRLATKLNTVITHLEQFLDLRDAILRVSADGLTILRALELWSTNDESLKGILFQIKGRHETFLGRFPFDHMVSLASRADSALQTARWHLKVLKEYDAIDEVPICPQND